MSDGRLVTFANDLLDELVSRLTTAGISIPSHRYVHSGDFAADFTEENCADALIVAFEGFVEGQGATTQGFIPGTPIACAVPLVARFTVALLRCVPTLKEDGAGPTAAELQISGEELMLDAMELANAIIGIYMDRGPCALASIGQTVPLGPQGAVGGNAVTVFTEMA